MPLLLTGQHSAASFAIWRMTETRDELEAIIGHDAAAAAVAGITSPKRVMERLAARALFRTAYPAHYCPVAYDGDGRPFLPGRGMRVSFSHTRGHVAMALAPCAVGVDIEQHGGKALRIASRFLNDGELARVNASPSPEVAAVAMWSAKETAYKIIGQSVYDFRRTLDVSPAVAAGEESLIVTCVAPGCPSNLALHCQVFDWGVLTVGAAE